MKIKVREIRMEKYHEENALIVDEYGLEDSGIYHRYILIEEAICETFAKQPDEEVSLNTFLEMHHITAEWQRYEWEMTIDEEEEEEIEQRYQLQESIELDNVLDKSDESQKHIKKRLEKKVYKELADYETLIENPLVIDIFNEATKQNPELSSWETVFPFFR